MVIPRNMTPICMFIFARNASRVPFSALRDRTLFEKVPIAVIKMMINVNISNTFKNIPLILQISFTPLSYRNKRAMAMFNCERKIETHNMPLRWQLHHRGVPLY